MITFLYANMQLVYVSLMGLFLEFLNQFEPILYFLKPISNMDATTGLLYTVFFFNLMQNISVPDQEDPYDFEPPGPGSVIML
jgi:hypothetical protein